MASARSPDSGTLSPPSRVDSKYRALDSCVACRSERTKGTIGIVHERTDVPRAYLAGKNLPDRVQGRADRDGIAEQQKRIADMMAAVETRASGDRA